jgi:hypothetical protein
MSRGYPLSEAVKDGIWELRARGLRLLAPLAQDLREWRLASGRPDQAENVIPAADGGEWSEVGYEHGSPACGLRRYARTPASRATRMSGSSRGTPPRPWRVVEFFDYVGDCPR